MFGKAGETVETAPPVTGETRLEQIRKQRRVAEANFNDAYANVSRHREMLARANGAMEKAKREFHAAEEEESSELMRLGLKK
jgi:hypothetical protein